jgi:hypothetical protein
MSRTIEAIERHMASRPRLAPVRLGLQPSAPSLIAEWQQHGPETLSGHAFRKLRLTLAPSQPVITGTAAA